MKSELHVTKSCDRKHGYERVDDGGAGRMASDEKIDAIVERLYSTHTASWRGEGDTPRSPADQGLSHTPASKGDIAVITARLYTTHTHAMKDHHDDGLVAEDIISGQAVSGAVLDGIIERMYQTHTESSRADNTRRRVCNNSIARKVESEEEINEIFKRLRTTHTKSSSGGAQCRPWEPMRAPGLGQKMLPPIEGLEVRFAGQQKIATDKLAELDQRMKSSQTTASQARLDPPRILLYPECTTLCNNVERIRTFQASGTTAKQAVLERREKWFN